MKKKIVNGLKTELLSTIVSKKLKTFQNIDKNDQID